MPSRINQSRSWCVSAPVIIACLVVASAAAETARNVRGAAADEPLPNEPPAKIIVDPPRAEPLSRGVVFIQYRTENLHIVPVFWPAGLAVVIINGLAPGRHKIPIQLVNANHQPIDQGTVQVTVPAAKPQPEAHQQLEFSL